MTLQLLLFFSESVVEVKHGILRWEHQSCPGFIAFHHLNRHLQQLQSHFNNSYILQSGNPPSFKGVWWFEPRSRNGHAPGTRYFEDSSSEPG